MMKNFSTSSFVAGAMLGVLFAGAWFFDGNSIFTPTQSSLYLATPTESSSERSDAISVTDQAFGTTVVVESVIVPSPSVWVAVREVNGTTLGNVLGAVRLGSSRNQVSIPLLRATEPGRTYAVQLYRDDASGMFDPAIFSMYIDFDTGARMVSYFTTTE